MDSNRGQIIGQLAQTSGFSSINASPEEKFEEPTSSPSLTQPALRLSRQLAFVTAYSLYFGDGLFLLALRYKAVADFLCFVLNAQIGTILGALVCEPAPLDSLRTAANGSALWGLGIRTLEFGLTCLPVALVGASFDQLLGSWIPEGKGRLMGYGTAGFFIHKAVTWGAWEFSCGPLFRSAPEPVFAAEAEVSKPQKVVRRVLNGYDGIVFSEASHIQSPFAPVLIDHILRGWHYLAFEPSPFESLVPPDGDNVLSTSQRTELLPLMQRKVAKEGEVPVPPPAGMADLEVLAPQPRQIAWAVLQKLAIAGAEVGVALCFQELVYVWFPQTRDSDSLRVRQAADLAVFGLTWGTSQLAQAAASRLAAWRAGGRGPGLFERSAVSPSAQPALPFQSCTESQDSAMEMTSIPLGQP